MPELIPPFSLTRQSQQLAAEIEPAVARVLASGRYAQGPECEAFEKEVAAAMGAPTLRVATCSSGTDALHLALRAVGVRAGDVVLTTPFTFFATAGAILLAGAVPEFVDIEPGSFNLDPAKLAQALEQPRSARIGAIMPVHLYGAVAAMPAILELAATHGIPVVEDAAQAIGASLDGRSAGAWGAAAAFSFYPTKNLGAMGEGGMVTTTEPAVDEQLRLLRAHGSRRRYEHGQMGWNGRMHELQAAILRAKLPHLAAWNQRRRAIATAYAERLAEVPGMTLPRHQAGDVFHQFVIRAPRREELRQFLREREVATEVYYPVPLHQQPALAAYRSTQPLPESERAAREVLALPMFPELTDAEVARVADGVAAFYGGKAARC
ncbi:MAG TPA: DegT/DnrJ/EryC1/StrS family aminotransferase [Terriglobales bacterium]|nr:DegT/DnrJ/EryC1/StrS family aminotransferase [Terriglobales bacterium]